MPDKRFDQELEPSDRVVPSSSPGAPGRLPATARVARGTTNIFRIELPSRDGNGVAAGAEDAVDRAAGSSATSLPVELMRKFESSLGADLSGVRVHTGSESADAARSVGAKAYTTGQDIHFGGGYYDPSTTDGQYLIAHEVAHTVQQAGSSARRQNKLEVSGPADTSEVEADRAAEAMIAGRPFALGGRGAATLARKPIETRSEIEKDGDDGASDPRRYGGLGESVAANLVTVEGKDQAQSLIGDIKSWQGRLGENKAFNQQGANEQVVVRLENFIAASNVVGTAVGGFQELFAHTQTEYGRLMAMAESPALLGLNVNKPSEQTGDALAEDHATRAAGGEGTSGELAERAAKIADTSGPGGGENKDLKKAIDETRTSEAAAKSAANRVADCGTMITANMTSLNAASQNIASQKSLSESARIKAAADKAKAEYEKHKKFLEDAFKVIDYVKDVVEKVGEGKVNDVAAKMGWDAFKEVTIDLLLPEPPDTATEEVKAAHAKEVGELQAFSAALNTFNAEGKKVAGTLKAFAEAFATLENAKAEHRRNVKTLGQAFDAADPKQKGATRKPGEMGTFETIAVFQGQADAFLVTADATKQMGERDLTWAGKGAGGDVAASESAAKSASNALAQANAMTAYRVEDVRTTDTENSPETGGGSGASSESGRTTTRVMATVVSVPVKIDNKEGEGCEEGERQGGLEGTVGEALTVLEGYITQIKQYKTKLGSVMGLN